jgi:hypothetical protein
MAQGQQAARGAGLATGLPGELELFSPFPFKGMEVKGSPTAIDDADFAWLENVMWIGNGQMAFLASSASSPFYTSTPLTIATYQFFVLNGNEFFVVFLSDGSSVELDIPGAAVIPMAPAGTFTLGPTLPVSATYGAKYLCIGSADSYHIWDGSVLYGPGGLAPQVTVTSAGQNYTSAPTVTIVGGSGTGATAFSQIVNGSVTSITLTNPGTGYGPHDGGSLQVLITGGGNADRLATGAAAIGGGGVISVQIVDGGTGYTNQPTVTFSGGGGSGATAVAAGTANSITQITVVTPGLGYTSAPTVTIGAPAGGGNTATGIAVVSLNGINTVTVTDGGAGYTSTPTVQITDPFGFGFGAVATANMGAGVVTSVTVINPGQDYHDAVVTFVGGNPNVATATVELMPQGGQNPVSGAAIQVFKNRVWMVNNTFRYTSAGGDVADFSAASGGIISQNNDNFLIYHLLGLAQSSGFLYEFGDSSVNAISNPTTTTVGATSTSPGVTSTTFTVTNVDPQVGCIWPQTIQNFGEAIIFANPTGIYGLYGSSVRKISTDLDDLFNNLPDQSGILPTACTVHLFGIKCYCISMQVFDPYQNLVRNLLLLWDGFKWFSATQEQLMLYLATVGVGGQFIGYGADHQHIWEMFSRPSVTLTKTMISKLYGATSALKAKRAMRFYLTAEQPMQYEVVLHSEFGDVSLGPLGYPNPGVIMPSPPGAYGRSFAVQYQDAQGVWGHYLGWTLTSTVAANNINYMALAWLPDAPAF